MKTQSTMLLHPLTDVSVTNITRQVKETLINSINGTAGKNFSLGDMWNIQRHYRSVFSRRRFL